MSDQDRNTVDSLPEREQIRESLEDALEGCGFRKEQSRSSCFETAFVRRGLIANLAFLVAEVLDTEFESASTRKLIDEGRVWCKDHLAARWIHKESGLNLVLLHTGQIDYVDIAGQVDTTGLHGAICQSITAINVRDGSVAQDKTWVVVGKVAKVLGKLRTIAR